MIFRQWDVCNETIILKSDNAPMQYKSKWAFHMYQQLADEYNVRIIRLYGAAGHGKGLIDAMSSFGVKALLRRDIITADAWIANSDERCNHLRMRGDRRMRYDVVNPEQLDRKRMEKVAFVIKDCTRMHLFDYRPNNKTVFCREFLCDCVSCLYFDFDQCLKENDNVQIIQDEEEVDESYFLDYENIEEGMKYMNLSRYLPCCSYCIQHHRANLYHSGNREGDCQKQDARSLR